MHSKFIRADSINAAAEQILDQLKADTSTAIYLDGWEGLGASAVLQAVALRLAVASSAGLQFEKIIHVDCSKWESRRVFQRAIAEQLELRAEVMEMFNRQDEEDDYRVLDPGSRRGIPQVQREIEGRIQDLNCRCLVIFHNGSCEEIDLASFGFPLPENLDTKLLWTFQGRFRLYPRIKVRQALSKSTVTAVFLSASNPDDRDLWPVLVRQEAAEIVQQSVVASTHKISIDPQLAPSLICHMLKLCCVGQHFRMDYDLATHICNYWICDGILDQLQRQDGDDQGDELWLAADAFKREILLDVDYYKYGHQYFLSHIVKYANNQWSWLPLEFLPIPIGAIPNADMFQDFDKLGVLKLSHRTFNFSQPPFVHCRNLKFLWLDNCHDDQQIIGTDAAAGTTALQRCFGQLLVLHVLNTCCDQILSAQMLDLMTQLRELNVTGAQDWDMCQLQGRLPNNRKLRVTNSIIRCSSGNSDLFPGTMKKMELLEFSGNHSAMKKSLSMAANSSFLVVETIIIHEGCVGLKKISFRGCAKLKNVLLRGLFQELESIDISGTAVKTLDLRAVAALRLDELIALGCGNLCVIMWPLRTKRKGYLSKLRIDITTIEDSTNATSLSVKYGSRAPTEYDWYVSVKDARLLWSLAPFNKYFDKRVLHMEVSTPSCCALDAGGSKLEQRIRKNGISGNERLPVLVTAQQQQPEIVNDAATVIYLDISASLNLQQEDDDGDTRTLTTQMWPCPRAPHLNPEHCYIYIQDTFNQPMRTSKLLRERATASASNYSTITSVSDMICHNAAILHVHDSKSITSIPGPLQGSRWGYLEWCRVERCPSLECVFFMGPQVIGSDGVAIFLYLETLFLSQLPRLRCIWNLSTSSSSLLVESSSFEDLEFVHVDLCPRLTHVLSMSTTMIHAGFMLHSLETLEIVWCGDLKAVFFLTSLDNNDDDKVLVVKFPRLKRIHLHELPLLHGICGSWRMDAPNLESIKVRGCWSLTCLPAVGGGDYNGKVECDCEKEWWDKLKPAPSLYKPTHPRHYKRTLLRDAVLASKGKKKDAVLVSKERKKKDAVLR